MSMPVSYGTGVKHPRPRCTLRYFGNKAPQDDTWAPGEPRTPPTSVVIDIGDASPEEARWWAAVLAPGRGWQAALTAGRECFWSPWSFRVQSGPRFIVPHQPELLQRRLPPAGFSEALEYLSNFCIRHEIVDQSHAALAAVLLLPAMRSGEGIRLPVVVVRSPPPPASPPSPTSPMSSLPQLHWPPGMHTQLDRLMAVSCYSEGIHPMLLNAFYNPEIACNAVAPWLQGALAVIDALAADKPLVLCRMLMDRQPNVAFLWLGVTVLGLQKRLLGCVRIGWTPANLPSAAWSGTLQSFLQQPVSAPPEVNGAVSRADQCRLLMMTVPPLHGRAPACPWKPFGENPVANTDLEVRLHARCEGHILQYYHAFQWDTDAGKMLVRLSGGPENGSVTSPGHASTQDDGEASTEIAVDYRGISRDHEFASQVATRAIFGWLRLGGFARGEKAIREHGWLGGPDLSESEDEEAEGTSSNDGWVQVLRPESEEEEMTDSAEEVSDGDEEVGAGDGEDDWFHVPRPGDEEWRAVSRD